MADYSLENFLVPPGAKVALDQLPTAIEPLFLTKEEYKKLLAEQVKDLSELQNKLYASERHAVLVILQGMDASGKDGVIRHVMSGINPQGCMVYSFKTPSAEELNHDFLWRTTCRLPQRGRIGVFNRSYYEEVLIVKVHPEILKNQKLPEEIQLSKNIWEDRYSSIVNFEEHLYRNGTTIIKIFLHLSKEEQAERFKKRIDKPEKNWKLNLGDVEERKYWDQYRHAYEESLTATNTKNAPWYLVPADNKENARLIVSQILLQRLKDLKLTYPKMTEQHLRELESIRQQL